MKNIKRFEIDVPTAFGDDEYDDVYPLQIIDLQQDYADAVDGAVVAEIRLRGEDDDDQARFEIGLEEIDALFDVLNHIKEKVLAKKKPERKEDVSSL